MSEQSVLTNDQRVKFEREGYLTFDPEIALDVIDGVRTDLESKYVWEGDTRYEDKVIYQPGSSPRIRDAWRISENVQRIASAPKVLRALEELYGRTMIAFQTLNFPVGTQQAAHSDAMHFRPAEPTLMCGVWLALEDIHSANGPLIYYPGSHRLPFVTYDNVDFTGRKSDYPDYRQFIFERNTHYEEHVQRLLEEHGLRPEYATIQKGHALIWASNLLHGGAPHEDKKCTRHSQVTHYLPRDSFSYYTPMRTEGEHEYWTEPEMVPVLS